MKGVYLDDDDDVNVDNDDNDDDEVMFVMERKFFVEVKVKGVYLHIFYQDDDEIDVDDVDYDDDNGDDIMFVTKKVVVMYNVMIDSLVVISTQQIVLFPTPVRRNQKRRDYSFSSSKFKLITTKSCWGQN